MIGIRRACDQYLFNLHEELIKSHWKAIQHASETFVIESSVYFVNVVYTVNIYIYILTVFIYIFIYIYTYTYIYIGICIYIYKYINKNKYKYINI